MNGLAKKNSRTKRILFWNCRGWRTARDTIDAFVSTSYTDIFGLCETFLDEFSIESIHVDDYPMFHVRPWCFK